MDTLHAVGHIAGAIISTLLLSTALFFLHYWLMQRSARRDLEEASLSLGIGNAELEGTALSPKLIHYFAQRFSSELFRNRFSDFVGVLAAAWNWLGFLAQLGVLTWITWTTFTSDHGDAVYAWAMIPVTLFVSIVAMTIAVVCKVLTGRYPGQASRARKGLVDTVRSQPS